MLQSGSQRAMEKTKNKVVVAMSGGVDSSVAAGLLCEAGYDVEGITMVFRGDGASSRRPAAFDPREAVSARETAERFGFPLHVVDMTDELNRDVIDNFSAEYLRGRTPNPCVRCNRLLKFGELLKKARDLRADYLATGHYARVEKDEKEGRPVLLKGADPKRDQSYFVYGISADDLGSVLFPLGGMTKDEVRRRARAYGLKAADRADSQDVCFVPDGGYKEFLLSREGSEKFVPGEFRDENNKVVGRHNGIANFTIGQRDKLGIALGRPVYVYRIDARTHTVYVGGEEKLFSRGLKASRLNWFGGRPAGRMEVSARIRYNSPEVEAEAEFDGQNAVVVAFREPQKAVTPGQSVVFYREDEVLGGAVIEEALSP